MKPIKPQSQWGSLGTNTKLTDFTGCYLSRSKPELQGSIFLVDWLFLRCFLFVSLWFFFWLVGWGFYFQGPLLNVVLVFRFVESCEIILLQVVHEEKNKRRKGWKGKEKKEKIKSKDKGKRKGKEVRGIRAEFLFECWGLSSCSVPRVTKASWDSPVAFTKEDTEVCSAITSEAVKAEGKKPTFLNK